MRKLFVVGNTGWNAVAGGGGRSLDCLLFPCALFCSVLFCCDRLNQSARRGCALRMANEEIVALVGAGGCHAIDLIVIDSGSSRCDDYLVLESILIMSLLWVVIT